MNKIQLSTSHLSASEIKYVKNAFNENNISIYGDNVDGFENDIQKYLGVNCNVLCTNSGTSALHLALILAGVKKGDEVICQSFTYVATVNPILYIGAKPIFIDSGYDNWNLCPLQLEIAVKDRVNKGNTPKAIVIVHSYGMPAKMQEIIFIAKKYNIPIIEDAAAAMGAEYKGQKCGTFGDFGVFSFNGNKIITTGGGGGLICKSEKIKRKALFLATQSREKNDFYQHKEIGYNYRINNILAGIGRGQMHVLEERINQRRNNHSFYTSFFNNIAGIEIVKEESSFSFSNHWLNCILIDHKKTGFLKEDLRLSLLNDNIESRYMWKPMHLQPLFKKYQYFGTNIAEQLFKKGLCLPSGSNLTRNDLERISNSIKKIL
ncbi:DegT/DnrJ/EryC1/StrS family aminotransferase [Polaribacter staleyi]|uniref:DegT/DnrJ/EryC1/StrS family aminotransferase n=1 Tax=Polaribacter staleyi TaxID=2022337 RepID=UPI0031BAF0ED